MNSCFNREIFVGKRKVSSSDSFDMVQIIDNVQFMNSSIEGEQKILNDQTINTTIDNEMIIKNHTNSTINDNTIIEYKWKSNCSKYMESFKPHFFLKEKNYENKIWNDTSFAKHLYYFSPLFEKFPNTEKVYVHNSKALLKKINNGYNKPYNNEIGVKSNFHALLNHYVKLLIMEDDIGLNINRKLLISTSVYETYVDILVRFFKNPYETSELDNIIFNIIIPFRNKVYCILFNNKRYEYCKICLYISDLYECCSLDPYDIQTKALGERYIKNAAQTLHIELKTYIRAKNNEYNVLDIAECFFDKFTEELCLKFYNILKNNKPMI